MLSEEIKTNVERLAILCLEAKQPDPLVSCKILIADALALEEELWEADIVVDERSVDGLAFVFRLQGIYDPKRQKWLEKE